MRTIEEKREWLKTLKPMTIVASENQFGWDCYRAYPYTVEQVANNPDLYYEKAGEADEAVNKVAFTYRGEVNDYDLEHQEQLKDNY